MKKRIVKNNFLISTLACALAVCTSIIIYTLYMKETMYKQVQSQTRLLMHILETTPEDNFSILYDIEGLTHGRVTYIYHDGVVTYDSHYDISTMENHADRPEIVRALKNEMSTVQRYSTTSDQVTYYCASKVGDGSVVRIAVTTNDIFMDILMETSPLVLLAIICIVTMCFMFSGVTTRRIVDNIEKYDVEKGDGNIYEELQPFINKIRRQNDIISRQVQNLTEEKLKLQSIFNNVKEGIIVCNSKSEIIQINPEARELFEIDTDNKEFRALVKIPEMHTVLETALSGGTEQAVFRLRDNWYQCIAGANSFDGDHGAIIIVMDITDQIERERDRRRFADSITHELKTPLTNILGYSQLISADIAKKEDIRNFGHIIESNAEILLTMIENVIRISGLESGEKFNMAPVNLKKIVRKAAEQQSPAADRKNISVSLELDDVEIMADSSLMYQLADNLISNAIKYNKENGWVKITLGKEGGNAVLSVADSGIGIRSENHESVFERFYVVEKSRNKNISSTGLGLSIVKHIVNLHRGSITLKSSLGKGSVFTVNLPLSVK